MAYKFNKWQKKWLEALESGEYAQCVGALCDGEGFCCLGVACEVLGMAADRPDPDSNWIYNGHEWLAPDLLVEKMKLNNDEGLFNQPYQLGGHGSLSGANDFGSTFAEIAAFMREYPEAVFHD